MAKTIEQRMEELRKEWLADGETDFTDDDLREALKMEDGYVEQNKYTKSATTEKKKREPKPKKVDEDKKKIIEIIHKALTDNGYGAIISNVDRTIDFDNYTVMLTKHRPKK